MATTTPEPVKAIRASGWLLLAAGVISVVAGILALVWPGITLLAFGLIAGINVLLFGILALVNAVADEGNVGTRLLVAILGVLGVLAGIVMMRRPGETLLVLLLALGLWLVLSGIVDAISALFEPADRGLRLLTGLVDLALGILILAWPELGLGTLVVFAAIAFIVRGLFAIYTGWQLRKLGALAPT